MKNDSVVDAPDLLAELNEHQQATLTELLDEYLQKLERGERFDPTDLTTEFPELREIFKCYIAKLNAIHGLAAELPRSSEFDLDSLQADGVCRLGEFEIIRELGRGGMGTVYEARQPALDRRVALKLLPMVATFDSRQVARFKNEANAAGQLQHPNIVPIYSVGSAQQIHYYAMQLIEGVSIDLWIATQSCQNYSDWRQPIRWAIEIAGALQCAHESGIVHRDVKPSNLMLDQTSRIWITDFGLARAQKDVSLTQSGDMIGTLRYMSPEQAAGKSEVVNHRTDLYSLAATLFEMLTLRPALEGDDSATLIKQLDRDEPIRLKDLRPELPADLSVVLQKAMAKCKDDRYDSAEQFAGDLRSVIDGRPTMARPPSPAVVVQRFASQHRKMMATAAGLLAILFVVSTITSGIIWKQNQDIRGHKLRADQNFRRARLTVDQLGSNVAAQLAAIPGTEQVRRTLLENTLDYYRQFIAQAADDRQLQTEIASTHSKIGCLVVQLEHSAAAIPHFRAAEKHFGQLPPGKSSNTDVRRLMAANLNHLGLALAVVGKMDESIVTYQRAIEIQTEVLQSRVDHSDVVQLAAMRNNLGLCYQEFGNERAARQLFAASIEQLDSESVQSFDDEHSRVLAAAMANLAALALESQPDETVRLLKAATAKRLAVVNDSSNRLLASSEIATMYGNLGSAQMKSDQLDGAIDSFRSAIRLQRKLYNIAPHVQSHRRDLAMSLNNIGMLHQRQRKTAESAAAVAEGVRLQQTLVDATFNHHDLIRLGAMEHNHAVALAALNQDARAGDLLSSAIDRQQQVLADSPQSQQAAAYLRQHLLALHKFQVRRGQWSKLKATEAALRQSAKGDRHSLETIEQEIRATRRKESRTKQNSVVMVQP